MILIIATLTLKLINFTFYIDIETNLINLIKYYYIDIESN